METNKQTIHKPANEGMRFFPAHGSSGPGMGHKMADSGTGGLVARGYRAVAQVFLLAGLLCSAGALHAQQRNFNWVFAAGTWFQFSADTMISVAMTDTVSLRNACISDTAGQFLLLADDFGIRNAQFQNLAGGTTQQLGWNVPAANYLILPRPGHPERYLVFINEDIPHGRAGWVEVDMEANGGSGAVLGATHWYMQNVTAKLTATTSADEQAYWVLQHGDDDDAFHAFLLSANGMAPLPVVSHAGSAFLPDASTAWPNPDRYGQMNFSFQGDRLALVKNDTSVDTSKIEIFNFDRAGGHVTHWADISLQDYYQSSLPDPHQPWMGFYIRDVEFDQRGRYLYSHNYSQSFKLVQYDLQWPVDSITFSFGNTLYGSSNPSTDPAAYDHALGPLIAAAPYGFGWSSGPLPPSTYGYLFMRKPIIPANYATLPTTQTYVSYRLPLGEPTTQLWIVHGWLLLSAANTRILGGLPSPCKRYTDDAQVDMAISETAPPMATGLRPNPMQDRAVLVFSGPVIDRGQRPEQVVWRDALGRVVQRDAVERNGPSVIIRRNGLPHGLYLVEVLAKDRSLGVVKVMCD